MLYWKNSEAIACLEEGLKNSTVTGDRSGITRNVSNLGSSYCNMEKYQKEIEYYKNCLELSTAIGDQSGIANNTSNLGNAHCRLGEYQKAIEYYKKGLAISNHIGDLSRMASDFGNLGSTYVSLGEYNKGIEHCEIGLEISTAIGDQSGIANENCALGNAYLRLGEYQKAIEYYEKGLEISTAIGDQSGIANNTGNLGNAYLSLGEYQKAIEYYEKGLEISTAIGDQSGIASNTGNLGNAYHSLGEYQKAIEYYEKGLEISTAIGDQSGIASDNGNLGNTYRILGEYEKAIQCCEKGLEISTAIGDQSGIANNTGNLGNAYLSLGEYQKAIEYYEKGLEISTAIGDLSGIANNTGNLGTAYLSLGEYQKAIEYYEKGLEISTAIGDQLGIANNTSNLGNAYLSLGEYQKAIEYYEKGLEISTAIGDQSGIASDNGNLGNTYRRLGEYEKAIQCCEKGLEISIATGDQSGITNNAGNLGNAYLSLGEYQKAIEYYEKGLEISTAIGDLSGIANNTGNLGNAYLSLGEYQKAIEYYEKALEISTAIGDQSGIASDNGNLGIAYFYSGEQKAARSHLEEAIRRFDEIFFSFVPDQNKLSFTPQYFYTHRFLMSCFLTLERAMSALLVIDRGKAKELHFCIKFEKNQNRADMELNDFALATWNRIKAGQEEIEIKEFKQILQVAKNDMSILVFAFDHEGFLNIFVLSKDFVFRKVDAAREAIASLIVELLRMVNVNVGRNSSFQENVSVGNACNQVNYPFGISARRPPSKPAVKKSSKYNSRRVQAILEKLFQLVINPVRNLLKGNKLIVVPDNQLFFAPFSSFIDENGRFLCSKYSIQITPSLHTLKASMQREHELTIGFALFVGNPIVGAISLNGEVFEPLPSAAEEVKYLADLFQAKPLLEREAKKQAVLQLLSEASIIHIAAHGEPKRGEIILAPNTSHDQSPESFLLRQEDITNILVKARLVVLCCCFTGQGEVSSEGVVGIARSFLAAGARSVLATLWPVNDAATVEIMKKFYDELCKETPVCEALRRAKNFFNEHDNKNYQSIKVWAPFTIYGEDVKFEKHEIEEIREKSRDFFTDFVVV